MYEKGETQDAISDELIAWLYSESNRFSTYIKSLVCVQLLNYEERKAIMGLIDSNRTLSLLTYGINAKVLTIKGGISYMQFCRTVNYYCFLEKYDEVESFISRYSDSLGSKVREATIEYARAKIALFKMDGTSALDILNHFSTSIYALKYSLRASLLLAYYLLYKTDVDFMEAQYKNYLNYHRRFGAPLSSATRGMDVHKNFVRILKLLAQNPDQEAGMEFYKKNQPSDNNLWVLYYIKTQLKPRAK